MLTDLASSGMSFSKLCCYRFVVRRLRCTSYVLIGNIRNSMLCAHLPFLCMYFLHVNVEWNLCLSVKTKHTIEA